MALSSQISRFPTESKNQFYLALIYFLCLFSWLGMVLWKPCHAMEVFIRASVVSLELTWLHHSKIESFKVNFNFKRFKVNVWFLRKKVQSLRLMFKGSKLTFKGSKLTFKGSKLLTLREDKTYPRQFISITSLELVSTTVELRTQWTWRFSTETIVSTNL